MSVEDLDRWTTDLLMLVFLPGEALCLMALIAGRGAYRYAGFLFGTSLLAALVSSVISTSLSETFVEPSFLDSFSKDGVWAVNPKYHPNLSQLLCAVAVVAVAFGITFYLLRRGRSGAGRGMLIVACSSLSAAAIWIWTVGSLYGYHVLVGG